MYTDVKFHTDGEERKDCYVCDYYESRIIHKLSENHVCEFTGEEWITSEATCTEEGFKYVYCYEPKCGKFESRTIPSKGHTAGVWTVITPATCTDRGVKEQRCINCTELLNTEYTPAMNHKMGDWYIYTEATFNADGEERKDCSNCEYYESKKTPKRSEGHICNYTGEEVVVVDATCTQNGSKHIFCYDSECPSYATGIVKAKGHILGDWYVYTEAKFHIDGEERKSCSACDYYESRIISKLSENHVCEFTGEEEIVSEATCTENGSKKIYCYEPECSGYELVTIEAIGHTAGEWIITKLATCTENGTKEQKCSVCNELINTESIPSLEHQYGPWLVIKEPTTTETGEQIRECIICYDTQSEVIEPVAVVGLLGDVNCDGKVNIKDATAIQKHLANISVLTDEGFALADVDGSGKVNIKDATAIQKHIAGIETGFPVATPVGSEEATFDEK